MANLVDHDVRDELLKTEASRLPFGYDRAPVERDSLGQGAGLLDALMVERHSLVQATQLHDQ